MQLTRINYKDLNGRQKEIYNFQKVAAMLADYGFNCIKLNDDWHGADFLAYHKDGSDTLKVQLKSRITVCKKYVGKDIHMAFPTSPASGVWYLVNHDELVEIVGRHSDWLHSESWKLKGQYSRETPGDILSRILKPYLLG
jgi:hypothetical protein